MIMGTEEKLKHWQTYIEELFDDQRQLSCDNFPEETGPEISKEEVMQAVKSLKNSKAPGPDELPVDILKLIDEDRVHLLVDLFNKIYENSIIPEELLRSTFVPHPKKAHAKQCNDHRTISLMSHTLQIFLKIIHNRIYRKLEEDIGQFEFLEGCGTCEVLFAFNSLTQRCLDVN
ncbi:unnamed protein product [Diabrotica balteata]|uniref:Reverse transcriptase domain-containing protein n=1 Tax=Diabrotica balteata TaxID=107213 RepID=A0A9N9TEI9_DIABA|nr:unnamed protein product [Diabrotica balteata]